MTDVGRVALAARVFTLAVLASITLVTGNGGLRALILIVAVAVAMEALSLTRQVSESLIAVLEGGMTSLVVILAFPDLDPVIPYLAIPALLGGLSAGFAGLARVIVVESVAITLGWWVVIGHVDRDLAAATITWVATGIGLGLLGRSFRYAITTSVTDASYRNALELLKQLHALSGKLTAGLDPVSLAEDVMERAAEVFPVRQSAVFVKGDSGVISPLHYSEGALAERFQGTEQWVDLCWTGQEALILSHRAAIPLQTDSQVIAVLVIDCDQTPEARPVAAFGATLSGLALRLYAALLFDDVRDSATSEERNRLAREVHDGVAQDVASLGYLVDNLAATAADEDQVGALKVLRHEVTRVVGELRHSVFDLRNGAGAGQGLGQSLSSFARHIGSHSDLTVHVTLDESLTRLRPEVESELLRIAQEGMNNARRHSGGENLWINCTVHPPHAAIEVLDDGLGLQPARADSHGLKIMHERAERIGADFKISTPALDGRGTRLRVQVGDVTG